MIRLLSELTQFYSVNDQLVNTLRFEIRLQKSIDGDTLRHAIDMAIRRYPYFSVKTAVVNEEYVLLANNEPIVVTHGAEPICLGSGEANHHLLALAYEEKSIFFDFFHGITDAIGAFPLIKTVLYYYLCERENTILASDGIRLADSEIPSEETDDPYPEYVPEDIRPLGEFKPCPQFCLPERTGPHAGEQSVYHIRIRETDFMRICKL